MSIFSLQLTSAKNDPTATAKAHTVTVHAVGEDRSKIRRVLETDLSKQYHHVDPFKVADVGIKRVRSWGTRIRTRNQKGGRA